MLKTVPPFTTSPLGRLLHKNEGEFQMGPSSIMAPLSSVLIEPSLPLCFFLCNECHLSAQLVSEGAYACRLLNRCAMSLAPVHFK